METNYTPLNIDKFNSGKSSSDKINTILLLIATITAAVLALLLFVLIQRKMKKVQTINPNVTITPTPPAGGSPTIIPTLEISPTVQVSTPSPQISVPQEASPTAKPSITISISPSATATPPAGGSATPAL